MIEILKKEIDKVLSKEAPVYTNRVSFRKAINDNEVYERAKGIAREFESRFREEGQNMDYDSMIRYICEKLRY